MADKKPGFFKRLFKFGKKKEPEEEIAEPTGPSQEELDRQAEAQRAAAEAEQRAKEEAEAAATREEEARRIAAEAAEAERLAEEAAKAEQERLEAERQAAEKLAREKTEAERLKAEEEARVAAERAAAEEREKKAAEEQAAKEAAERKAAEEAEAARLETERQEREARERAEQKAIQEAADAEEAARLKAEAEKARQTEEERLAKEQAERERQAAEKERQEEEQQKAEAEQKARREEEERLAQERAEQEATEAEAKRLAEEQAEQDRAEAEARRIAAEKEAAEAEAKRLAEEQAAKDAAAKEAKRLADEEAAREAERAAAETAAPPPAVAPTEEEPKEKTSWFNRLKGGLSRSSTSLTESITSVFTKKKLDDDTLQDLEDILIRADLGVETAMSITDKLASQRMGKDVSSEEVRGIMADEIEAVLEPVAAELELDLDHQPHVILVVGVNGSGKTTTIGKLSQKLYDAGFSTLLVAGDTFRAAAIEQLKIWGDRTQSPVLSRPLGADAAGLAFDAYEQAKSEGRDVMLMDTAGRLQNRTELMDELAKIVRVLKKQDPEAPHTVLLTLDATTGQNALNQVEIFRDIAGVNGLVMTKLDGTARGGILVAISAKHKLPVFFLGVGEQVDDLEPFEAKDFARSIAGLA